MAAGISRCAWVIFPHYDQRVMAGPPFSISAAEIEYHYGSVYRPQRLASDPVTAGPKGLLGGQEQVWLLTSHKT